MAVIVDTPADDSSPADRESWTLTANKDEMLRAVECYDGSVRKVIELSSQWKPRVGRRMQPSSQGLADRHFRAEIRKEDFAQNVSCLIKLEVSHTGDH